MMIKIVANIVVLFTCLSVQNKSDIVNAPPTKTSKNTKGFLGIHNIYQPQ